MVQTEQTRTHIARRASQAERTERTISHHLSIPPISIIRSFGIYSLSSERPGCIMDNSETADTAGAEHSKTGQDAAKRRESFSSQNSQTAKE